jgi:hypothetical protein
MNFCDAQKTGSHLTGSPSASQNEIYFVKCLKAATYISDYALIIMVKIKITFSLCLTQVWGSECIDSPFFTLALLRGDWLASRPGRFIPRESAPRSHWIGGWGGSGKAAQDEMEKRKSLSLPILDLRPLGLPARSQLLYRLIIVTITTNRNVYIRAASEAWGKPWPDLLLSHVSSSFFCGSYTVRLRRARLDPACSRIFLMASRLIYRPAGSSAACIV